MSEKICIKEIECKSALGRCGFPGGGLAVNPYVGCEHDCQYCYARFMRRFAGHADERWGSFVDARMNVAETLERQMANKYKSSKIPAGWKRQTIYIGTVTDPYQPCEKKFSLTREVLTVLKKYQNPVSVLTKSDLILRDLDIIREIKEVDVNFTINSMDERWASSVEPNAPAVQRRWSAAQKITEAGVPVNIMMGPLWPYFTNIEKIFEKGAEIGAAKIFSESFNTIGGNWNGIEEVLKKYYPEKLSLFQNIFFNPIEFKKFYNDSQIHINNLSNKYKIPVETFFGQGHAGKFDRK